MVLTLNCDSQEIKNWEITPEGYMKLWLSVAKANQDLVYTIDGGTRTEFINRENLFNKDSINSAIGKHLTFNHPPQAITGNNWRDYAVGVALQEFAEDGDNLLMASMIYDSKIIEDIKKGDIKFTSSGYSAVKLPLNQDGKIEQKTRSYNHFGLLDKNFVPRAGTSSRVVVLGLNKDSNNATNQNNNADMTNTNNNDSKTFSQNNLTELIQLHTNWDSVLSSNGKSIDYNMDALTLKRKILECYYPSHQIARLQDSNLDGFWINFELNRELIEENTNTRNHNNSVAQNNDSATSSRNTFIARLENRTN